MKTETKPIISEEIKKYLNKPEGRKYFREITKDYTASNRNSLKKSIINPSERTVKRNRVEALLESKIKELDIKKKLDINNQA